MRTGLAELDSRAKRAGLYVLREKSQWKVYDSASGKAVATIYPDKWNVLLHFGSHDKLDATDAFDALAKIEKLRGRS